MDKKEILSQIQPLFDNLIKTIDHFFPDNEGIVIMWGLRHDNIIVCDVGGNAKTDYGTACKIATSCVSYVSDYFGYSENEEPRL